MEAPDLSPRLARTELALHALDVQPTPREWVWLARLAWQADAPLEYGVPSVYGSAIVYGGATFWPYSNLAAHWFARWHPIFVGNIEVQPWVYGYAHAQSRAGNKMLLELTELCQVADAVTSWSKHIAFPVGQLGPLYERLQQLDNLELSVHAPGWKPAAEKELNLLVDIVALCKAFPGTTPTYWRSDISKAETDAIVDALRAYQKTATDTIQPDSRRDKAIHSYHSAVKWVLIAHGANVTEAPSDTPEDTPDNG